MTTCELCDNGPALESYLCENCSLDTADRLAALPAMFDDLTLMLGPGQSSDGGRRGSRPAASPVPNLKALDHRAAFGMLPSWRNALYDAMGRRAPALTGDLGVRVVDAVRVLRTNMAWITSEWPAAGDFAGEVRDLFNGIRTVVGEPELAARMGPCPATYDGVLCGAPLRLPDGQHVVRCLWCEATYPPGVWMALRRAQAATLALASGS